MAAAAPRFSPPAEAGAGRCCSRWPTRATRCSISSCCAGWCPTRRASVITSTPKQLISDESQVSLRAEVRDRTYLPRLRRQGRGAHSGSGRHRGSGRDAARSDRAGRLHRGLDHAQARIVSWWKWSPRAAREELGRDTMTFRREDGVAENFHIRAESRTAGEAVVGNRRPLLYTRKMRRNWARTSATPRRASRCAKRATCGTCPSYSCCC